MEDRDVLDEFKGWADRDGGCSGKGGVLLVEQEDPNECFKVFLPDMSAELPKRGQGIPACCINI